jgi:hypothetical protein
MLKIVDFYRKLKGLHHRYLDQLRIIMGTLVVKQLIVVVVVEQPKKTPTGMELLRILQ